MELWAILSKRRSVEDAAREMGVVSLHEAQQLVRLYAERGSPKYEPAAWKWLVRYLSEGTPSLTSSVLD